MTSERHDDEIVSATYREMAAERTPEHLDASVLQLAARSGRRPSYSRSISWTRPLAWAATIVLCLAITLQVTRVPTPTTIGEPAIGEAVSSDRPDIAPATDKLQLASPEAEEPRQKALQALPEPIKAGNNAFGRSAAKQVADTPKRESGTFEKVGLVEVEEDAIEETVPSAAQELKDNDADMLPRAEEMARMRDGQNEQADVERHAALASAVSAPPNECSDDARRKPETWLECIDALEKAGNEEAATRQRENLIDTFPDFQLP